MHAFSRLPSHDRQTLAAGLSPYASGLDGLSTDIEIHRFS